MNIDWSKAPEGATHGREHQSGVDFYKREDGLWLYFTNRGKWDIAMGTNESSCESRPLLWNGEGLPPVGVPVEYQRRGAPSGKWHPTQINFLSGQHVIFCDSDGDEIRENPSDILFRPIRTLDQIAAEECDKAVKAMLAEFEHTSSLTSHYEVCEVLHKAGYRKQVAP